MIQFHNNLFWLKFNPKYFRQHYTDFRQIYQECLKQNAQFTYASTQTSVLFVRTTQ